MILANTQLSSIKIARDSQDISADDDEIHIVTQEDFVDAIALVREKYGIPDDDDDDEDSESDSESDSDSGDSIIENPAPFKPKPTTTQSPDEELYEDPKLKASRLLVLKSWQFMQPDFTRAKGIDWDPIMRATWGFCTADGMKVVVLA